MQTSRHHSERDLNESLLCCRIASVISHNLLVHLNPPFVFALIPLLFPFYISAGGRPPPALLHLPLCCPHYWCLCSQVSDISSRKSSSIISIGLLDRCFRLSSEISTSLRFFTPWQGRWASTQIYNSLALFFLFFVGNVYFPIRKCDQQSMLKQVSVGCTTHLSKYT